MTENNRAGRDTAERIESWNVGAVTEAGSSAVLSGALEVLLLLGTDSPKGDYSRGQRPKNSVITKASIYKKKVDASLRING